MARGIFFRHVLREMLVAALVVGLVLLVVLATYQLSFVLGRAANGELPGSMVPELALLSLRTSLPVILPFALLLGVTAALGRLYHDNEIAAAQACGVPAATLTAAAATVTAAMALLAAWSTFIDGPQAARRSVELRLAAQRSAALRQLAPGAFRSPGAGITLYFRAAGADGSMQDVFVQRDQPGSKRVQVVVARSANQRLAADGAAWLVELDDGRSYEGVPGAADWRITHFARQLLSIPLPRASLHGPPRVDGFTNRQLLASGQARQLAELHWRIGWVVAVIMLGLVAVPLGKLAPRQGRYARLPWAVLLFAVQAGLLTVGRTMLGRGEWPPSIGLWWVPLAVAAPAWWRLRARRRRD
ncbi:MAG TPA: LPS export ABC transporter permease LptF [Steroidobacteraceae bacterium]|nr:LPS export ABC transporter permease LptF [Steroidobacteraceae bacterium]